MTNPTPITLDTNSGPSCWPYSLSQFIALDAEMRSTLSCPACKGEIRVGDMVDRSTFKIAMINGVRCRKVRFKPECPKCGSSIPTAQKSGPLPLVKSGEPDSLIELWRKWSGLPPLI